MDNNGEPAERRGFNWRGVFFNVVIFMAIRRFLSPSSRPSSSPPIYNVMPSDSGFDILFALTETRNSKLEDILRAENSYIIADMYSVNGAHRHDFNMSYYINDISKYVDAAQHTEKSNLYISVAVIPHNCYRERKENIIDNEISTFEHINIESYPLIQYLPRLSSDHKLTNLLSDDKPDINEEDGDIYPYWKSKLDVRLVFDSSVLHRQTTQTPPYNYYIKTVENKYLPILFVSDMWLTERDYIELNGTDKTVDLRIIWDIISLRKFTFMSQLGSSLSLDKDEIPGKSYPSLLSMHQTKSEIFMLKRILLDTNIYLIIFSVGFIMLHSIFSILAFKNDIQFWHNNESMEGLSALSMVISFVCQVVVALYLLDSEKASSLLFIDIFTGIGLSGWKLTKALKFEMKKEFPYINIKDAKDYAKNDTKKYDETAIKYMSMILMPCVCIYAVYALYNYKYKSWYSYIISTLAGAVYTFGFIMMTPQLYINYKLKSVDHLPWRALGYKAMNTFVDDVASLIIDMPMMHRMACFRDDIIFIAYLYQRWAYKVDKSRSSIWSDREVAKEIEDKDVQEQDKDVQEQDKDVQEQDKDVQEQDKDVQEQDKDVQEKDKVDQETDKDVQEPDKGDKENDKGDQENDEGDQKEDADDKIADETESVDKACLEKRDGLRRRKNKAD